MAENAPTYDYIILGAGSAGCVLADRLTEDGGARVLLLEAGPRDRNPLLRVPILTGTFLRGSGYNWAFEGEPDPSLGGRRVAHPRGRVLGGSSAINGMVYARGFALDYDSWAQQGLAGWSYADVLPYFRRSERFEEDEDEGGFHGREGPVAVSRPDPDNPLYRAWIEAGRQAGFPLTRDFNGAQAEGFGTFHFTIGNGKRVGSAHAFLRRAERRPNLRVHTGAHVSELTFAGTRCTGVRWLERGSEFRAEARREVIVSLGVFGSPTLLMRSGLGPAEELRQHGVPVRADMAGVGANLQDHPAIRVHMACTKPITLHRLRRADRAFAALLQALVAGTGPASRFPLLAGAFLRTRPGLEWPDIQCHFLPGMTTGTIRWNPFAKAGTLDQHGFFANACVLRPHSRGRVRLGGPDPFAPPRIETNALGDPRDVAVLRDAIGLLRRVFAQPAFDPYRGTEILPGAEVRSPEALDAFIRDTAVTVFHPVGTCRMGTDPAAGAVVDAALRVHGFQGVRVVDASIMPNVTSGNTHAPAMMIAEKAADIIRAASR